MTAVASPAVPFGTASGRMPLTRRHRIPAVALVGVEGREPA
ncbi:hypothetical protein ABGB18_19155 [Nonomuraea sp. B12E4]